MNSKNRCGFIFDMDGTLVDNMRFHTVAWQKMLDEQGYDIAAEEFLTKTAGKTNREIIPAIFGDISEEMIAGIAGRKEQLYREAYLPHRKPLQGAIDFLSETKAAGITMALATAAPPENVEFILDGLDLSKYFDAITTAADVVNGKPDPEVFLVSAEKLGLRPSSCIVFEDALNGFEAARRAGMRSIGIATVNPIEDMIALPGIIGAYRDFSQISLQDIVGAFVPFEAEV